MLDGFGDALGAVNGGHGADVAVFDIDHEVFEIEGEACFGADVSAGAETLIDLPLSGLVGGGTGNGGAVIEVEEGVSGDFHSGGVGALEVLGGGRPDVASAPGGGKVGAPSGGAH